jgi:lipopolysaccharide transport system ATP-binding protein
MTDFAIEVENLSKRYRIGLQEDQQETLVGAAVSWLKSPLHNFRRLRRLSAFDGEDGADVIWALRDVNFEVKQGEVVGIIGRNGAGKSTLLKILSRITPPTRGRVVLNGRVASLLEVGTGFHSELSGRENIYLNGTILGMSKAEIDRKFDEIVDFSGVEKFIDTAVKRYSSGMRVRLAFSIAAHLEPKILLIDEVLAVGDIAFQRKCLGKMEHIAQGGRTVLFVSHNMPMISSLCERCILLQEGQIKAIGKTNSIIQLYREGLDERTSISLVDRTDRKGSGEMQFTNLEVCGVGLTGTLHDTVKIGQGVEFNICYRSTMGEPLRSIDVALTIFDMFDRAITTCNTRFHDSQFNELPPKGVLTCRVAQLPLVTGFYKVSLWAGIHENTVDHLLDAGSFEVIESDFFQTGKLPVQSKGGPVLLAFEWDLVN